MIKLLGLNYPGGKEIEERAKNGNENFYDLPKPLINENTLNFSFSGIKTHINLLTKNNKIDDDFINNLSASFQKTIVEIIIAKITRTINNIKKQNTLVRSVSVVGGVANNIYIRKKLESFFKEKKLELYYPLNEMMGDNAAMIACACIKNFNIEKNNIFFKPMPRMAINKSLR